MKFLTLYPLENAFQTGRYMHKYVKEYYLDMAPFADYSLQDIFTEIANLPFYPDPPYVELLRRPAYLLYGIPFNISFSYGERSIFEWMRKYGRFPGGDCDDKSIAIGAWARLNGIPYRFLGVGRKNPHKKVKKVLLTHVYPELYIDGAWLTIDATYSYNTLGYNLGGYDRIEVLKP